MDLVVEKWWKEVCRSVNGALLFMDGAAAECLHWHGGLNRMLECGAVGIRNFCVSETVSPALKRVVFILTSPISDEVLRTLKAIIRGSSFKSCLVISSLPPECQQIELSDSSRSYREIENRLLSWMGNMNYSAKVLHIPIFAACLLPNLFIMPAYSNNFGPVSAEFKLFQALKDASDHGIKSLPMEIQLNVKMLTSNISALLEGLQSKCDVFSLGPLSHIVGTELENMTQASKKKVLPSKASVLLFDRSLDLAGPLSQVVETPFGKMLKILPHLSGHVCDVGVSMTDLASCISDQVFGMPLLAPGCIAHKNNSAERDVLHELLTSKIKEAVMEINRKLVQLGVAEGFTFDSSNMSAPKALKKRILLYKDKPHLMMKHNGLLQQALAVVQVIEHPTNSSLDNILAAEKLLVQNLALSQNNVGDDIHRLISSRKERGYKLVDVLTLIAFLYALCDNDVLDEDARLSLQATIMETLLQIDSETEELVSSIVAYDDADDQDIFLAVKTFFEVLRRISKLRRNLKTYRSIFESGDPALPANYISLFKQVVEDIFNSSEIPDLEYHSSGLGDYIRAGFGLFMKGTKPQPKDNPILIIIILGGITDSEIKTLNDIASRHKSTKVFVGSTSLLTPKDVMSDLFSVVKSLSDSDEFVSE